MLWPAYRVVLLCCSSYLIQYVRYIAVLPSLTYACQVAECATGRRLNTLVGVFRDERPRQHIFDTLHWSKFERIQHVGW